MTAVVDNRVSPTGVAAWKSATTDSRICSINIKLVIAKKNPVNLYHKSEKLKKKKRGLICEISRNLL